MKINQLLRKVPILIIDKTRIQAFLLIFFFTDNIYIYIKNAKLRIKSYIKSVIILLFVLFDKSKLIETIYFVILFLI